MERIDLAKYHERRAENWKHRCEYELEAKMTVLDGIRDIIAYARAEHGTGWVDVAVLERLLWEHGERP